MQADIAADPRAGRGFRVAAVRLSVQKTETEGFLDASAEAARWLFSLALAGSADELRRLLSPDPIDHAVTWTVDCFQTGDLTPIATRDFDDPVEALTAVADHSDEERAASELVACTAQGLRWTAIVRTHDRVLFQLPNAETFTDRSDAGGDVPALRRWRKRLADWSAHSGGELDTDVIARLEPTTATAGASTFVLDERFAVLTRRLAAIEASMSGLSLDVETVTLAANERETIAVAERERDAEAATADVDARLAVFESALRGVEARTAEVDATTAADVDARIAAFESVMRDALSMVSVELSKSVEAAMQRLSERLDAIEDQLATPAYDPALHEAAVRTDFVQLFSALRAGSDQPPPTG
jgi:hypothetical protein